MNYVIPGIAGLLSAAVVTWAVLGLVYFDGIATIVDTFDLARVVVFFKAGSRFHLRTNAIVMEFLAGRGRHTLVKFLTCPFSIGGCLLLLTAPLVYWLLAGELFHLRGLVMSGLAAAGFFTVPLFLCVRAGKIPLRSMRMRPE